MFDSKNRDILLESINLAHMKNAPDLLRGSVDCLMFEDDINKRNISICIDDQTTLDSIKSNYLFFYGCRIDEGLEKFDASQINNIIKASCNGIKDTKGKKFDMPALKNIVKTGLINSGVIFYM